MYKSRSGYSKPSAFGRFFQSVFAVVVLSALILGITFGVRGLSNTNIETLIAKASPLLAKLNINVDEKKAGDVAGKFVERISQTNLGSGATSSRLDVESDNAVVSDPEKKELFSIALVSDVHEDTVSLEKTLKMVKTEGIENVFLLGDATNYGDISSLQKVKNVLDNSGLKYYVLPGDHDLAQSVSVDNFKQVFGYEDRVVTVGGYRFMLFNNAYNFTTISADRISWFKNNLETIDFVLLSQPLYTKGLSSFFENIFMGSTPTEPEDPNMKIKQEEVRDQGLALLSLIRSENKIKAVFAGEHHKSSKVVDQIKPSLEHYVVGAVSDTVNDYPQSIIQTSRFSLFTMYEDQTYQVNDIVLN